MDEQFNHIYICQACDKDFNNATNLNKHLHICPLYDDWINTYKPVKTIKCDKCNYVYLESYIEHHYRTCNI